MEQIQIKPIKCEQAWIIRHEVMYPDLPFEVIKLANDNEGVHLGLYVNNHLTSVVSLFNKANSCQFRKFATLASAQGKGYGSLLLDHVIQHVKVIGMVKLWCNARVSAASFYAKFGFTETDDRSVSNGINFVIMELHLNN